MKPIDISEIHDRMRYSTKSSTLIAGDDYWDGHNFERSGRQTFLYQSILGGSYFAVHLTQWTGERDHIEPLSQDEAATLYESLPERRLSFEEAFPGVQLVEA